MEEEINENPYIHTRYANLPEYPERKTFARECKKMTSKGI